MKNGRSTGGSERGVIIGEDIICISSIDWDFIWQGHQEIMATLATHGNRVLFIENTGVRAPKLRDFPRLKHRLLSWWRSTNGFRQERENLFIYSPLVLPFPYSRVARWINRALLLRALQRWMRATRFHQPIVWTFLPTPLVVDLIDRLDALLVVYYCIADFEQLSLRSRKISRSERKLIDRSDVVFVQSEELRRRCIPHPNSHIFPFGVNMEIFGRPADPAPELKSLKAPIIGYAGGIHRHLDFSLLERIALGVQGTLVLVGPIQTNVGSLRKLDNVVFAGRQPHSRIPEFIRGFNAGIIPYLLTEYTRNVYPTKLNEYLAVGIPVVATDLPEIRRFNAEHGEVVAIASDGEAFVRAIREAVEKTSPADTERRIEIARQNSWAVRIAQMSKVIEDALAARRADGGRWEESLRRLYRTARRRIVQTAAGVGVAFVTLFYTPLVWFLAEPLRVAEPARPADAIVVFAGGVGESGKAGGGYQERVKQAVDLYHGGKASRLIFSSGYTFAYLEAEVMAALAVTHGVPASVIVLEMKAANTYENVIFVKEILNQNGWRTILLVSSPYHMRRALMTYRKVAPEITVVPTPVPASQFYAHVRGASLEQISGILHEYAAIVTYWWRGWI